MFAAVCEAVAAVLMLAAPPELEPVRLRDFERFPPAAVACSYRDLNRAHGHWIRERMQLAEGANYDGWWIWMLANDTCGEPWYLLARALEDDKPDEYRLGKLAELRDALGP